MEIPLGEVVDSQYAFPILGVILCALLVFAFGFKSPSQPPSFDDTDSDKKVSSKKRRQVKDSQKTKSQSAAKSQLNGHCPTPLPKAVPAVQAKLKKDKVAVAAKPKNTQTKPLEVKKGLQEKNSTTRAKMESDKVLDQNAGTTIMQQEDNDGDWVQLLSKKEKKIRRKGEGKDSSGDGSESPKAIPSKHKEQQQHEEANKKAGPQPTQETTDPEEHPKDQRNKRKDKTLPAPPEPIKSTKKEKREEESRVVKPKVKLEKRCAAEEASTEAGSSTALAKEDPSASQKADDLATPGNSNVAFDELGDAWQESKPQKKKKKARKD